MDDDTLGDLRDRAEAALDELHEVNASLTGIAAEIEISEPPDLPEADMEALEEAQAESRDSVLIDSDMDFAEAVDRLNAHSEMAARRRPK